MFAALCRARCAAVIAVAVSFGGFAAGAQAKSHPRHRAHVAVISEAMPATANTPCANADTPNTQATEAQMTAAVDCLVNEQRLAHGLPELTVANKLNHSAQGWTDQMIKLNIVAHGTGSEQQQANEVGARIAAAGYNWQNADENIDAGFLTPRDAVAAWMGDQGHCQNILDPGIRSMGTAESPASVAGYAGLWTQDYGLDANQNPLTQNTAPQSGCPYAIPSSPQG
jgi:uncharacterized protein YkwD